MVARRGSERFVCRDGIHWGLYVARTLYVCDRGHFTWALGHRAPFTGEECDVEVNVLRTDEFGCEFENAELCPAPVKIATAEQEAFWRLGGADV